MSYTLRYVSLKELGNVFQVGFREEFGNVCQVELREPMHLCTDVSKEGGDGEGTDTEAPSLLSKFVYYESIKRS